MLSNQFSGLDAEVGAQEYMRKIESVASRTGVPSHLLARSAQRRAQLALTLRNDER